jgi:geranylgeranyl diphosphate synthase type I
MTGEDRQTLADVRSPVDVRAYMAARHELVEQYLMESLRDGNHPKVLEAIAYYPMAGGKRLRPILAMASADALEEGAGRRALPYGCALELVHNFTLIHDDLMDEDELRRGRPTLHTVWDPASAINAGDVLFALAFEVISRTDVEAEVLRTLLSETARTVFEIGEGQQWDMDFEKANPDEIGEGDYLRMIEFKTARLFEQAARGGARVAGADDVLAREMGLFAREMGIAFQIWDDYLDIFADQSKLGKDVGSDIRNGKLTLMALHALDHTRGESKERFLVTFGNPDASSEEVREAISIMESVGSINHARDLARKYARRAEEHLSRLPPSEHREFLRSLIYHMISREY